MMRCVDAQLFLGAQHVLDWLRRHPFCGRSICGRTFCRQPICCRTFIQDNLQDKECAASDGCSSDVRVGDREIKRKIYQKWESKPPSSMRRAVFIRKEWTFVRSDLKPQIELDLEGIISWCTSHYSFKFFLSSFVTKKGQILSSIYLKPFYIFCDELKFSVASTYWLLFKDLLYSLKHLPSALGHHHPHPKWNCYVFLTDKLVVT